MRFLTLASVLVTASALSAVGPAALVTAEKVSGHVGFYDADGNHIKDVKVGVHPHELAFSPDGHYVYATDNGVLWMTEKGNGENTISIIDVRTQAKAGVVDLGRYRRPHGIDVDPQTGQVLVTTELPSALLIIDPAARKVIKTYDVKGQAPHMVRLAPDRRWAYVSNTDTGTVAAIELPTGQVKVIPVGQRPQGTAFSPDAKRLYVANLNSPFITVIDTEKKQAVGQIATGQGPVRVVVSPDGRQLVYALQQAKAVGFASIATGKEEKQVPLTGPPVSMTLSADGKSAYCSVQEQDKVFVISLAERKLTRTMQFQPHSGPDPVLPLPPAAR